MTPADFAAELRRRLDRLPGVPPHGARIERHTEEGGHWYFSEQRISDLYTALTAAPPREEPPDHADFTALQEQGFEAIKRAVESRRRRPMPSPDPLGFSAARMAQGEADIEAGRVTPLNEVMDRLRDSPVPPAPEDGTRWVVQAEEDVFLVTAHCWGAGLEKALKFSELEAYREALRHQWNRDNVRLTVRRVRRQPGTRRWEEIARAEVGETVSPPYVHADAPAHIYRIRELPPAPGPWQLDPEGT